MQFVYGKSFLHNGLQVEMRWPEPWHELRHYGRVGRVIQGRGAGRSLVRRAVALAGHGRQATVGLTAIGCKFHRGVGCLPRG